MKLSVILIIFTVSRCFCKIPSDIQLCKIKDTDCIAKSTTDLINNNPNGRQDIGLPNLEPLKIKSLVFNQGEGGPVNLQLTFKDVDLTGLSQGIVNKAVGFDNDPKTSKFEMYITFPKLILKGKYKINGRILVLPIEGEGDADILLENLKTSTKLKLNITKIDERLHMQVEKLKVLLEPTEMKIKLTNLFNGDKTLGENTNTFLNENWKDVWEELSSIINEAFGAVIVNLLNGIFNNITYDEIFIKD